MHMSDERTERESSESQQGDEQYSPESRQLSEIADEVENVTKEQKRIKERLVESRSLTISPTLPLDYLEAYERLCPGSHVCGYPLNVTTIRHLVSHSHECKRPHNGSNVTSEIAVVRNLALAEMA